VLLQQFEKPFTLAAMKGGVQAVGVSGEFGMQLRAWIDVGKHVSFLASVFTGLSGTVCFPQLSERLCLDDRNDSKVCLPMIGVTCTFVPRADT
jgi:hypothetical protein